MLKAVDGVLIEPLNSDPKPDVFTDDADYWSYIHEAMTMVVHRPYSDVFRDYGTAYESIAMQDRAMPYTMAGKSGTAQVVGISQEILSSEDIVVSDLNKDHGLFVSFAPAMHPRLTRKSPSQSLSKMVNMAAALPDPLPSRSLIPICLIFSDWILVRQILKLPGQ